MNSNDNNLTPNLISRLALIKYILKTANYHSYQPEPLCYIAILLYHDCIELFLRLAIEHHNISASKDAPLLKCWDLIDDRLDQDKLSYKQSFIRLNDCRASLKHRDIPPSISFVRECNSIANLFFEENSRIVFGIDFENISMIDLIVFNDTKEDLSLAQDMISKNELEKSMEHISLGFFKLISNYEKQIRITANRFSLSLGPFWAFKTRFFLHIEDKKVGEAIDSQRQAIEFLYEGLKIIGFGIDYRKYILFKSLTPFSWMDINGKTHVSWLNEIDVQNNECQFCFDFVIESALRLQEVQFEYLLPNL